MKKAFFLISSFFVLLLIFQNCGDSFNPIKTQQESAFEVTPEFPSTVKEPDPTEPVVVSEPEVPVSPVEPIKPVEPEQPEAMVKRCDDGWVLIPGNPDLGTKDFCIMKFEAQNSAQDSFSLREREASEPLEPGFITSNTFNNALPLSGLSQKTKLSQPWVYVTQKQALAACKRIDAHLTTMAEAQTVSRNLFLQKLNWDSNQVGKGCLYGGHLDLDPATSLPAPLSEKGMDNHYFMTNDFVDQIPEKNMGKCFTRRKMVNGAYEVHKNGWLSRRSHVLSTNEFIWDWSGNVSEWIANTCNNNGLGEGVEAVFTGQSNGFGFFDYNFAAHPNTQEPGRAGPVYTEWTDSYLGDYESLVLGPKNPKVPGSQLINSNWGAGMYQGCRFNGRGIYRGGAVYHGYEGGIFQTHMDHTTDFNHRYIGFRCVKAPNN